MKTKKILAMVLSVIMLIGAIPFSTFVSAGETVETLTSVDGEAITLTPTEEYSDYVTLYKTNQKTEQDVPIWALDKVGDVNWDRPSTYGSFPAKNTNNGSKAATYGFSDATSDKVPRWAYVAIKTNVTSDGSYDISAKLNMDSAATERNVMVVVDGMMHYATCATSGKIDAPEEISLSLELTAGEHIILFSFPVTKDISTAKSSGTAKWANYHSITVDGDMAVLKAPTVEEVSSSVKNAARIEAEDTNYATLSGGYAVRDANTASGKKSVSHNVNYGLDSNELKALSQSIKNNNITTDSYRMFVDKNLTLPYVEYQVRAEKSGTYNLRVGAWIQQSGKYPKAVLVANETVYESEFNFNTSKKYCNAYFTVALNEGVNTIRVLGMALDMTSDNNLNFDIQQDYLELDSKLIPVKKTTVEMQTIQAADSTKVTYGNFADEDKTDTAIKGAAVGDIQWDKLTLDRLNMGNLPRIPYVSIKVTANADGYYNIGGDFRTSTNGQKTIGVILDDEVYTTTLSPNLSVWLTKGTHTIIFTSPMPKTKSAIGENSNNYNWPWMDVYSITVDKSLTVESAPNLEDMIPTRLEVEDAIYASYNQTGAGTYTSETKNGASGNTVAGGINDKALKQTKEDVKNKLGIGTTPYIQYAVETPSAGTYELGVGMFVDSKNHGNDKPYATVMVNDKVYQTQFVSEWYSFGHSTVQVEMKEGINIIRLVALTCEQEAYQYEVENDGWLYINYDYLDVPKNVTPIEHSQVVQAGDETKVRFNKFKDNGDRLGNAVWSDASWDKTTIETITMDNLPRTAYAAFKVNAENDGTYEIVLQSSWAEVNATSDTIAMFVDGIPTAVEYPVKIDSMMFINVELTKGEHVITFTSPLPATQEVLKQNAPNVYNANQMTLEINNEKATQYAYPAIDFSNIILGSGLSAVDSVPTKAEVEYPNYNRIEAEDNNYVVYNLYKGEAEKWTGASEGSVIGGFATGGVQSYEDIVANGLDLAHVGVLEYLVTAPKAGEYSIRVAYLAGKPKDSSVAKPYVAVVINDSEKVYKAQYDADWKEIDIAELKVTLKEGRNYVRITGMTGDQAAYQAGGSYINHDFVDFQKGLQLEKRTYAVFEAEDSQYVNLYKVQDGEKQEKASNGKVLGGSTQTEMIRREIRMDSLNEKNIQYVPNFSVTINVPADGYYSMRLNQNARNKYTTTYLAMVIDGKVNVVKYGRVSANMNQNTVDVSAYLTAGEHTIVFTCPMPLNAQDDQTYMWMNFDKVTFYDGITIAKTQKAPFTSVGTLIFEAEDYALPNMSYKNTAKSYSGGAHIGDIRCKKTQTLAEIKKDGIDGNRTPYTQFTIFAKEAGEYEVNALYRYAFWSEEPTIDGEIDTTFVISANGKYYPVTKKAATGTRTRYIGATISLQKGENKVIFVCPTRDSHRGEGYVWANIDYVEISKAYENKISFVKLGGVVEAELSEFANYDRSTSKKASGGRRIGNATYANMDRLDVTWDNLDVKNLSEVPHVVYNVIAEKAGTYDVSVQFNGGTDTYKQEEMDVLGPFTFAMSINGGEKQKVQFVPGTSGGLMSRVITIDLKEGENLITFTTLLADYFRGVSPSVPEDYRLYWVDHDALFLSAGLSAAEVKEKSVDDSSVGHPQIKVGTRTDKEEESVSGFQKLSAWLSEQNPTGMLVGSSALVLLAILFIIILVLRKKKKNEEVKPL